MAEFRRTAYGDAQPVQLTEHLRSAGILASIRFQSGDAAYITADTTAPTLDAALGTFVNDPAWKPPSPFTPGQTVMVNTDGSLYSVPSPSIPAGVIVMWSGLLSAIPSGWLLCDGQNGTPDLRGKFIKGALAAANPGVTGGAAAHSHPNHVLTQPSAHAFTQPGVHSAHVVTQPGAHPNHVVTQPGAHPNHVVTQPSAHADVLNHVHVENLQGGTTGTTTGTHLMGSAATGGSLRAAGQSTANPTSGGVASQAHAGAAVDAHSAHSGAAVDAHSAHSGTAVDAHSAHTGGAVDAHSGTAVDAHASVNSEPAFYSLAYIQKT